MGDFSKLNVWKAAHALTLDAYRVTGRLPREEMFGLVSQIRRAAVAVAANIAESTGRRSGLDQARFIQIARSSAIETRSHFMIARDLGFVPTDTQARLDSQLAEIERMLAAMLRYYKTQDQGPKTKK